jgi:predicted metal-binding protein
MNVATTDRKGLEALIRDHGFEDYRFIRAGDIAVAEWVRMKCRFGCPEYGTAVACPPNVPSVAECERFVREYEEAVILHFARTAPDREERRRWSRKANADLLALERAVFLSGRHKAFMLLMGSCPHCEECVGRPEDCRLPGSARPTPEGLAIDVYATARSAGYPIQVVTDHGQPENRYAILLVE